MKTHQGKPVYGVAGHRATKINDKHYIRVRSDRHGRPSKNDLIADHMDPAEADPPFFLPLWRGKKDAHDYWAYWKIVTAAMNCAIDNQDCDYARGPTQELVSMGKWSDGTPVEPMQYNPPVWDNDGQCYPLEDPNNPENSACYLVNKIDPNTEESAWKWRGRKVKPVTDPYPTP